MTGWLLRRFFRLWVRTAVQPSEPPPAPPSPPVPVCYLLERDSGAALAVLCNATGRLHLPSPEKRSGSLPIEERPIYFAAGRRRRFWDAMDLRRPPPHLQALIETL